MAEPKYIDANKVIDYANQEITAAFYYPQDAQEKRKQDEQAYRDKWAFVKQIMVSMPAADVEEVVRCKDCIHYMPYDWMFSEIRRSENIEDYPQDEIGCEWIDHHINPQGYCSYGERKENE